MATLKTWHSKILRLSVSIIFCFPTSEVFTQPANTIAWETTLHYSALWRHTPKLTIKTGQPVFGQEWGLRLQTQGRQPWHQWQRYPAFGLALAHFHLGEQAHGDAWALLPNLSVPVWRTGRWLLVFRVGTGLGYVTRPYDYFNNPGENAIGSHWNNYTQFRLGSEYRLNDHWRLQAGVSLNHFSNGASALPNFGVNLPSGLLSFCWSPKGIREADFAPAPESKRPLRRWGAAISGGLAMIEYSVFDGPRYPVWALSGGVLFHLNRVNRLQAGLDYEYNRAVYTFGLRAAQFRSENAARRGATRLAVTLADEFLFGALSVQVLTGVYTGGTINQLVSNSWYGKFTTRYYFRPLPHAPFRLHAGVSLKAHRTTAEYISLNVGAEIGRRE